VSDTDLHARLDELVRLQALALVRDCKNQAEAIALLGLAGLSNNRIAELLGTTPATVRVALHKRARKTKTDGSKSAAG
jgi:DNA-binding CsgD family transcriptional regulator